MTDKEKVWTMQHLMKSFLEIKMLRSDNQPELNLEIETKDYKTCFIEKTLFLTKNHMRYYYRNFNFPFSTSKLQFQRDKSGETYQKVLYGKIYNHFQRVLHSLLPKLKDYMKHTLLQVFHFQKYNQLHPGDIRLLAGPEQPMRILLFSDSEGVFPLFPYVC